MVVDAAVGGGPGVFGLAVVVVVLLLVYAVLTPAPAAELPSLDEIRLTSHAVERHGEQALEARARVFGCDVEHLRARYCPRSIKYGVRVHFWCERPGAGLCPGVVTTIGGVEKTSFVKPCEYWRRCQ